MTVAPRPTATFRLIAAFSRFALSPVEVVGPETARRELARASRGPGWLVGARRDLASVCDDTVAGVPVRRYRPHDARPGTIVLFHGGGWMLGNVETHDGLARALAAETTHEVMSVEYRRAPEHRYPAALDDAEAVTRALVARDRVVVAGDSAGGNLAASVANRVPVAGQFLMYPVTDCADERPSHEIYGTGHVLTREAIRYFRREYVPDVAQRHESGASPVRASSLAQSAPAYLVIAQCDVVRDEGVAYAGRLQEAGVDVTLDEVPGTLHGFMSMLGLRQARGALRRAAPWLRSRLQS